MKNRSRFQITFRYSERLLNVIKLVIRIYDRYMIRYNFLQICIVSLDSQQLFSFINQPFIQLYFVHVSLGKFQFLTFG